MLIKKLSKTDEVIFYKKSRCCDETFIRLLTQLMFMNDDDTITIVSPNKTETLDKEQFADYIVKFKNSKLLNVESINKFKEKF